MSTLDTNAKCFYSWTKLNVFRLSSLSSEEASFSVVEFAMKPQWLSVSLMGKTNGLDLVDLRFLFKSDLDRFSWDLEFIET